MNYSSRLSRLFHPAKNQQALALPGIILALLTNILLVASSLMDGMNVSVDRVSLIIGFGSLLYLALFYVFIISIIDRFPERSWIFVTLNVSAAISIVFYAPFLPAGYPLLSILLMITISAVVFGRWRTYVFLSCVTFAHIIALSMDNGNLNQSLFSTLFLLSLSGIAITETILRLQESLQIEIRRQQILNKVSHSLSSSLEIHQVITMVTTAVQGALDADTYYFGLLHGDSVHLELFYDDGEFFPSMDVPLEGTLAGKVINSRQPLLIHDLPEERKKMGINFKLVGKPRISRSWMGVPIEAGGKKLGIIAVASYQKDAFDSKDLELLVNISRQAALALDNAYHHLEVETRSQLDSLTGVFNHNAFLVQLELFVQSATITNQPISLIMLDIDHFKAYNDTYGHLTGDRVLIELAQMIRRNIKKSDLVGRWGGEEFAIALPESDIAQANRVAERIRDGSQKLIILNRDQEAVPAPTISQGIAVLPNEVTGIEALIDLADQRLYIAKERGRNQIQTSRAPDNSMISKN